MPESGTKRGTSGHSGVGCAYGGRRLICQIIGRVAPWVNEHVARWERALGSLRSEGWTVVITCAAAPVQLEGSLPSGEKFYFRARHDEARLAIGGREPIDRADWEGSEDHPGASYLSAEDGLPIIERLVVIYMARPT